MLDLYSIFRSGKLFATKTGSTTISFIFWSYTPYPSLVIVFKCIDSIGFLIKDGFFKVLVILNYIEVKDGQPVLPPFEQNSLTFTILIVELLTANTQVIATPVNYEQVGLAFATSNTLLGNTTYILAPVSIGLARLIEMVRSVF